MSHTECSRRCGTAIADLDLSAIEPTVKFQVCLPRHAIQMCEFEKLLLIEREVGIERTVALDALCMTIFGGGQSVEDPEIVIALAALLQKKHMFTAAEIENQLFLVETDNEMSQADERSGLDLQLQVLREVESNLDRKLAPTIDDPTHFESGLAGYFRGRAEARPRRLSYSARYSSEEECVIC